MSRTIGVGYIYRQYSKKGVYLADFKSSREAHQATGVSVGSIVRAVHGERRTGGGFVWRKVREECPRDDIEIDLVSKIGYHYKRPLVQKTRAGEVIGEFLSIAHASKTLKISRRSLSCALSGAQKTAGGFVWEELKRPETEDEKDGAERASGPDGPDGPDGPGKAQAGEQES